MPGKPKLYAHRVKILKYVKVGEAWRFANVVKRSGRIVRDHILITGRDEHHPEGSYYLEWYEHGKRHRKAVADFATAQSGGRFGAAIMVSAILAIQTAWGLGAVFAALAVMLAIAAYAVTQIGSETRGLALDAIAPPTG